jgi:hypothetical protein
MTDSDAIALSKQLNRLVFNPDTGRIFSLSDDEIISCDAKAISQNTYDTMLNANNDVTKAVLLGGIDRKDVVSLMMLSPWRNYSP